MVVYSHYLVEEEYQVPKIKASEFREIEQWLSERTTALLSDLRAMSNKYKIVGIPGDTLIEVKDNDIRNLLIWIMTYAGNSLNADISDHIEKLGKAVLAPKEYTLSLQESTPPTLRQSMRLIRSSVSSSLDGKEKNLSIYFENIQKIYQEHVPCKIKDIPELLDQYSVTSFIPIDKSKLTESITVGDKEYRAYDTSFGVGGFGSVFYAQDSTTHELVAIKKSEQPQKRFWLLENELTVSLKVSHPYIIKYIAGHIVSSTLVLVMELFPKGNLFNLIAASHDGLCDLLVLKLLHDITSALSYLHHVLQITHDDIKPNNILVNYNNGSFKLCDFGNAFHAALAPKFKHHPVSAAEYIAPEIYAKKPPSPSCDMWSLGIVLHEALTCTSVVPLHGDDIKRSNFRDFFAQNTDLEDMEIHFSSTFKPCKFLYQTTKQLLKIKPDNRPKAAEIYQATEQELTARLSL